MNLELVPTARHSTAPSSFHYAVTSQGEASARTLGIRHRTTLPKTGIDGYGVPVRNDIFVNAMISRKRHCHQDPRRYRRSPELQGTGGKGQRDGMGKHRQNSGADPLQRNFPRDKGKGRSVTLQKECDSQRLF